MKKKALAVLGAVLMTFTGFSITAHAAGTPAEVKKVILTNEDVITYTDGSIKLEDAFTGMAPGESRMAAIRIENQNSHFASFFISGEATKALEEINDSAKGAAYEMQISIGRDQASAVSLLDMIAGGYSSELVASNDGLKDITGLKDYQFLAELKNGEYTNIYLTITLDGEGLDSTSAVDYSNAIGSIEFNFRAYYGDEKDPVIVTDYVREKGTNIIKTQVVDRIVALAGGVQTGDTTSIGLLFVILTAGIGPVVIAVKKGKVESRE